MNDTRPNLFIVGAPKCGTTSLYEYLRAHPDVFFPFDEKRYARTKEPNHFCPELGITDEHSIKDRAEYLDLYRGGADAAWRGDASVYHLLSATAAERIKQFSPHARILIALRPPVEMMRSYHGELLRHQHEDIADFHAAVDASEDRRKGLRIPARSGVPHCLDYFAISRFAEQVERYLDVFGEASVKVVLLEDLAAEPARTYRDILAFLGVDESFAPTFSVHNERPRRGATERAITFLYQHFGIKQAAQLLLPHARRRQLLSLIRRIDRDEIAADARDAQLAQACRADVQRLSKLTGRDLGHWQPGAAHGLSRRAQPRGP